MYELGRSVVIMITITVLSLAGCAANRHLSNIYPPLMEQSENGRLYEKIATIEFSSERFGNIEGVTPQDLDWAHGELRKRAYQLGADAVILPEVRVERDTFLFFPSSQIRARGVAVKFH